MLAPDRALVELEQLVFRWRGAAVPLLEIETLRVAPGERLFIAGPSGSGKSTLLSLLAGVLVPERGSVRVGEERLEAMGGAARDRYRADHVGYIFQLFNLISYLSVVENVTLPCRFSARRAARARERGGGAQAEALRLLEHLGMGEPARAGRPVSELSVGQQQRVAAARALIGGPELVIADEPTSSLDAAHREAFLELLFRECTAAGSALVFVSHDRSLAALFERALQLPEINRAGRAAA
jgi:putative ABC transport system ATP-binding protein